MASGTQNLSSELYKKIQNYQIIGNRVVGIILPATYYTVYQLLVYRYYNIKIKQQRSSVCLSHFPHTIISSYNICFTCVLYFLCLLLYSRLLVFQLILFHDRCTAAWADVVQCHLVKGLGGKYFYKLPKSGLAGKFQMCFHEKTVRSRWCLSPVF